MPSGKGLNQWGRKFYCHEFKGDVTNKTVGGKKKRKKKNFRKLSLKSDHKILLMKPCLRAVVKYDVLFTSTVTQAAFTISPLNTAGLCLPSEICGS